MLKNMRFAILLILFLFQLFPGRVVSADTGDPAVYSTSEVQRRQELDRIDKSIAEMFRKIKETPKDNKRMISEYKLQLGKIYLDRAEMLQDWKGNESSRKDYENATRYINESGQAWDLLMKQIVWGDFDILKKYVKKGDSIADIGTGDGKYIYFLSDMVGETGKVFCIDINPYCLKTIKDVRKSREYKSIILINNNKFDLKLPPDSIDFALMRGSAWPALGGRLSMKLPNEKSTFVSLCRSLKKNGILCIIDGIPVNQLKVDKDAVAKCVNNVVKTKKFRLIRVIKKQIIDDLDGTEEIYLTILFKKI
jgi:ubiquinone/menaquinone biosynthesis C-methylase UbiE